MRGLKKLHMIAQKDKNPDRHGNMATLQDLVLKSDEQNFINLIKKHFKANMFPKSKKGRPKICSCLVFFLSYLQIKILPFDVDLLPLPFHVEPPICIIIIILFFGCTSLDGTKICHGKICFFSHSLGRFSLSVAMSVSCVCVCVSAPSRKTLFPVNWRLLVDECIANRGIPLNIFFFLLFQ